MATKAKPAKKKTASKVSLQNLRVSKKAADKVKGGVMAGPPSLD